jgi:hypothetical protein
MVMPVVSTAMRRIVRGPLRSRNEPSIGDVMAARIPPSETAPEISVRDQPNSAVIGPMNTDSVATAGPTRASDTQHTTPRMTQP